MEGKENPRRPPANRLRPIHNFSEIERLIKYKGEINANIGIRVNTNILQTRFGFNIESGEASNAIKLLNDNNVIIKGIHFHASAGQNFDLYNSL